MNEQEILTIVLSGLFLISGILVALSSLNFKTLMVLILMALSGLFMVITIRNMSYDRGQIDAIKGKQKFEQVIHYEWVDTLYCPVETTYVVKPSVIFQLPINIQKTR